MTTTTTRGPRGGEARPPAETHSPHETEGGRLLAKALAARGISWAQASRVLGYHSTYLRRLIVGLSPCPPAVAGSIRAQFGVPPGAWKRAARGPVPRRPSGPVPASPVAR